MARNVVKIAKMIKTGKVGRNGKPIKKLTTVSKTVSTNARRGTGGNTAYSSDSAKLASERIRANTNTKLANISARVTNTGMIAQELGRTVRQGVGTMYPTGVTQNINGGLSSKGGTVRDEDSENNSYNPDKSTGII